MTDRRSFLKSSGLAIASASLAGAAPLAAAAAPAKSVRIKKAIKIGMAPGNLPLVERFKLIKSCGYDGVDMDAPNSYDRAEVLKARDESGLEIHGCVDSVHWKDTLTHPDPAVQEKGVVALRKALEDCKAYGGTTVLLVPAVVNEEVTYDQAWERSQANIKKVLPDAERLGIVIALENVWNNFLISPLETKYYVDEINSPFLKVYFDIGNVLRYGWPEQWIRILGKERIVKLDVKEFSRDKMNEQGLWKGFDVKLGDGSVDWPKVTEALAEIGYEGYGTAEMPGGDAAYLTDLAKRMDRCFGMA